ncbi:hypothetical protein M0802_013401 [Mischocyttarus mexicanus]|nr:hypothetical protein M0802_013401 [Mischocyttarus mexicanus]
MCFGGLPRAGSRDWPANLEPGMGMLLPDETYEERSSFNSISNTTTEDLFDDIDEYEAAKALAVLQKCDDFLKKYGIRPEFFCKHRERLALQSWLLQKSKLSSVYIVFSIPSQIVQTTFFNQAHRHLAKLGQWAKAVSGFWGM